MGGKHTPPEIKKNKTKHTNTHIGTDVSRSIASVDKATGDLI